MLCSVILGAGLPIIPVELIPANSKLGPAIRWDCLDTPVDTTISLPEGIERLVLHFMQGAIRVTEIYPHVCATQGFFVLPGQIDAKQPFTVLWGILSWRQGQWLLKPTT